MHSFIPLSCAESDDSLPFSGASSILLFYIPFPSTHFHQLFFHPPSLHLAIYFLVYLSASLFPNSYIIQGGSNMTGTVTGLFTHKSVPVIFEPPCTFLAILFSSILCTCPNQHNLFNLIVSVIVGFLTTVLIYLLVNILQFSFSLSYTGPKILLYTFLSNMFICFLSLFVSFQVSDAFVKVLFINLLFSLTLNF